MGNFVKKAVTFFLLISMLGGSCPVDASESSGALGLPAPGARLECSTPLDPAIMKGIRLDPDNPFQIDFIVNIGDDKLQGEPFTEESMKLIKYFLTSLTVQDDRMWVNLSPYEKDRIIPDEISATDMGRDLLAQDYLLKQLTASLMYPEEEIGEAFWKRIYARAYEEYGTTDIPLDTFNKVWIVPEKATVYVHGKSAYVLGHHLKVMMEEDYFSACAERSGQCPVLRDQTREPSLNHGMKGSESLSPTPDHRSLTTNLIKEIIIPEIEREVNQGKNFAPLRQIFNSVILATWYKKNLQETLLGQVYADQGKVHGLEIDDRQISQKIYVQYLEAFKKGVYNYIREDYDQASREVISRQYFSGGVVAKVPVQEEDFSMATQSQIGAPNDLKVIETRLLPSHRVSESMHYHGFQGNRISGQYEAFYERLANDIEKRDAHIIAFDANYGGGRSTLINGRQDLGVKGMASYLEERLQRPVIVFPGNVFQVPREERTRLIDALPEGQVLDNAEELFFNQELSSKYIKQMYHFFQSNGSKDILQLSPLVHDEPGIFYTDKDEKNRHHFPPIPANAIVLIERPFSFNFIDREFIDIGVFLGTRNPDVNLQRILVRTAEEQSRSPEYILKREKMIQQPTYQRLIEQMHYLAGFHYLILNDDFKNPEICVNAFKDPALPVRVDWLQLKTEGQVIDAIAQSKSQAFDLVIQEEGVQGFDATVSLMREAHKARYPLNVGSSSRSAKVLLGAMGLGDILDIDQVVDGHTIKEMRLQPKPASDLFDLAASRVGIGSAGGVVIEDQPDGVRAGVAGGYTVIAIDREGNEDALKEAGAHIVLKDLQGFTLEDVIALHHQVKGQDVPFEGLILDNDGVIVNSELIHFKAYQRALREYLNYRENVFQEQHASLTEDEYFQHIASRGAQKGLRNFFHGRGIDFDLAMAVKAAVGESLSQEGVDPLSDTQIKNGGIDLNPSHMDLQTQGEQLTFDFPMTPEGFKFLGFDGFVPVITDVLPFTADTVWKDAL